MLVDARPVLTDGEDGSVLGTTGAPPLKGLASSDEAVRALAAQALTSDQLSVTITQADDDNRIVWATPSFAALTGYPLDEVLGRGYDFLHRANADQEAWARLHGSSATTLTLPIYRKDGSPLLSRMVVAPIHDESGRITHHMVVQVDATAEVIRERTVAAEETLVEYRPARTEMVYRVVRALTEHLDNHQAADALARNAVPELADWGFVVLLDTDGKPEYFTEVVAGPAKHRSARTVTAALSRWTDNTAWADHAPCLRQAMSARTGEHPVLPQMVDADLLARLVDTATLTKGTASARVRKALVDLGTGSQLLVPLCARNRMLGLMVLESPDLDRFDVPSVISAMLLARRVGTVLDDIRMYQSERPDALTLPHLPQDPSDESTEVPVDESEGLAVAVRALRTSRMPVLISDVVTSKIVWANDPYCEMVGWPREELIGRSWETVHSQQPDETYASRVIDSLNTGNPAAMTLINQRKDGTKFWSRMVVAPVRDAAGDITHTMAVHSDATGTVITEHAQAAEAELGANRGSRLELITRVLDAMTERTGLYETTDALARAVVPELADWGYVMLFDDDGRPEHWSFAAADPTKSTSLRAVEEHLPGWVRRSDWLKATLQVRPGDPVLPQLVDPSVFGEVVKVAADGMNDLGAGALLAVPLYARDRMLGLMVLLSRTPDRFDVTTVVTATLLRGRVSTVLDNARLYEVERAAALALQHRLLPPTVALDDLDTAVAYRPSGRFAEIGGDWYDVFPLGRRGTMLAVGDIVGHDMSAAAAMGQLSLLLRARGWFDASPAPMLQTITSALDGLGWNDIASVVCLRWEPTADGDHVEYTNLGHPAPFVRLPDGGVYQMRGAHSQPLGLHDPAAEIGQHAFDLPAGSVVVLYTDGLVERRDRPLEDGLAALARALRSAPGGTAAQIRDHLLATLVHDEPEDDVCLLVVRGLPTSARPVSTRTPNRQEDEHARQLLSAVREGERRIQEEHARWREKSEPDRRTHPDTKNSPAPPPSTWYQQTNGPVLLALDDDGKIASPGPVLHPGTP